MHAVFSKVFELSTGAAVLMLIVFLLRILLRSAPKIITCLLWALVAVKLLCPFNFESRISVVPPVSLTPLEITEVFTPVSVESLKKPSSAEASSPANEPSEALTEPETDSENAEGISIWVKAEKYYPYFWLGGMAVMLLYAAISYIRLKGKVRVSIETEKNVYLSDDIDSPFILGVFKPKIYLPSTVSQAETAYILSHEKAHIRRLDNVWKPLGFLILTVHWFNPLCWLAYSLFCRDIELACDERVIGAYSVENRKIYSTILLKFSVSGTRFQVCPLAFGENSVRSRIKAVLRYKKPTLWVVIAAVAVCIIAACCFMTNRGRPTDTDIDRDVLEQAVSNAILEHNRGHYHPGECVSEAHTILGAEELDGKVTVYCHVSYSEYVFENGYFTQGSGGSNPAVIYFDKTPDGLTFDRIKEPEDGTHYSRSINRMFPKKYLYRVWNMTKAEENSMREQSRRYAQEYLDQIGRDAEIRHMRDIPYALLTDVGVSVEVSNKLSDVEKYSDFMGRCPYYIGTREDLIDGVRHVFEKAYLADCSLIVYKEYLYDSGEILNVAYVNAKTAELVPEDEAQAILSAV